MEHFYFIHLLSVHKRCGRFSRTDHLGFANRPIGIVEQGACELKRETSFVIGWFYKMTSEFLRFKA